MGRRALIAIDIQNDFCPGGALAVDQGDHIIDTVNNMMRKFDYVIATQDWHPVDHVSFASSHSAKKPMEKTTVDGIEQVLWPDHCVQGSEGAQLHSSLNMEPVSLILRKGFRRGLDSYSAFFENDHSTPTGLDGYLQTLNITDLYFCGLATDYCVYFSASDAITLNYSVKIIIDACRGVDFPENNVQNTLDDLENRGASLIYSKELS